MFHIFIFPNEFSGLRGRSLAFVRVFSSPFHWFLVIWLLARLQETPQAVVDAVGGQFTWTTMLV